MVGEECLLTWHSTWTSCRIAFADLLAVGHFCVSHHMTAVDIWQIALAVVAALGGGGFIVLRLSSFLGKLWADRLMMDEKAEHDRQLERLRSELQRSTSVELEQLKKHLEVAAATHLRETSDKLAAYREIVDLVTEVLGDFDEFSRSGVPFADGAERRDRYNRKRIKIYAQMAMFAPQSVMDAYDALSAHLLLVADGKSPYVWANVRDLGIRLINEVRKDIGLDKSPILYKAAL